MRKNEKNGIQWLTFDLFDEHPEVIQGIFLRHGGVSQGSIGSLNLGYSVGDLPEQVMANLALIQKTIDLPEPVISSRQLHGTEINRISSKEANEAIAGDGLITNISGLSLMIKHADCQAALFYDPIKKAIANVHSGWRGSVQNIYQKTVEKMKQEYGSKPEDILVGISPSLGPEAAQFINYKTEIPKSLWKFQIKPLYFDFWAISEMQLTSAGILPDHIEIARQCTFSNEQDFFSHRRNPATGRHGCFIALKRHYE